MGYEAPHAAEVGGVSNLLFNLSVKMPIPLLAWICNASVYTRLDHTMATQPFILGVSSDITEVARTCPCDEGQALVSEVVLETVLKASMYRNTERSINLAYRTFFALDPLTIPYFYANNERFCLAFRLSTVSHGAKLGSSSRAEGVHQQQD